MTRDEQIIEASHNYGKTLNEEAAFDYEDMKCAFKKGAKWADEHPNLESIWHDASKFPNKALPIIVEIDDDIEPSYEVISIDGTDEKFWKFLASDRDITRWAYVKNLLPKGGAK